MRISYRWLADLIEEVPEVDRLAELLTHAGLEVEGIFRRGQDLSRVVVGKVLSKEKVPGSDRLNVCRVDVGQGEPLQIVCGAANYGVGALVPAALVGAELPGGLKIGAARLKGVESHGMLCSEKELGLSEDASGLMLLEPELAPGTPIVSALHLDDVALELNATPNRPDWLSHLGVARELSALTGVPLKAPPPGPPENGAAARECIAVEIDAPDRCGRYGARVVEGVAFAPAPRWMRSRLELCGVRALGNVIDVTNYVLLELGEPLHAFDLDRVRGARIVVRTAAEGERLTTLDGKERALSSEDLVIADAGRPLVLAGVMGGADAEVGEGTKRVLLEAAWFAPGGVRRSARRHALHTESSHRFERGADVSMVPRALDRAAALIHELAGGEVRRGIVDAFPGRREPARVRLRYRRVSQLLGVEVAAGESRRVLLSLGLNATGEGPDEALFEIPTSRGDLTREADLIEEVARVRGYGQIPVQPPRSTGQVPADDARSRLLAVARRALAGAGVDETIHMAFADPADLRAVGAERYLSLKNPLAETQGAMRSSMLPALLRTLSFNLKRQVEDVRLYEVGHVFLPEPGREQAVVEPTMLAGVLHGRRRPAGWSEPAAPLDFFDAKGVVEDVLGAAGIEAAFEPGSAPHLHPVSASRITARGVALGQLGKLHPLVAAHFDIPRGVLVFELSVDALSALANLQPSFRGVPRFPAVLRDLAVVVPAELPAVRVLAELTGRAGAGLVEHVSLFDVYQGPQVPAGKKSLAFAIRYRAADRTLKDDEVQAVHEALLSALQGLGAELRA